MQEGTISHAGEEAFKRTLLPLSGIISLLSAYASAKLEVFSTTRGASLAFSLLPFPAPRRLETPDGKIGFHTGWRKQILQRFLAPIRQIICCASINLS